MDNPEIPIQGAASGSEDFWSRSLDHTRTFDDQPHRGRAIVDDMRDHGRHSHAQDSGRESGRGLSRGHGSGYYREYDRDRSRHDSDRAGTNDNRYRDRDYYPRKYREREHDSYRDSYRDGGTNRSDRRRCYICNTPGHLAYRHNAWALTHKRHAAGSIGMTEPVHLSINSRAQLSILPQRIPQQQDLMPPVNLSAMATAWQHYLVPGLDEVGNALETLQSAAVTMGAAALHAEVSAVFSSWDKWITPGRVRMERSLASITTGPGETHGQEGQMSSSTMTCHGHSQDDSKYSVNENVANMNGAVDVAYPHVANEYDFDVY